MRNKGSLNSQKAIQGANQSFQRSQVKKSQKDQKFFEQTLSGVKLEKLQDAGVNIAEFMDFLSKSKVPEINVQALEHLPEDVFISPKITNGRDSLMGRFIRILLLQQTIKSAGLLDVSQSVLPNQNNPFELALQSAQQNLDLPVVAVQPDIKTQAPVADENLVQKDQIPPVPEFMLAGYDYIPNPALLAAGKAAYALGGMSAALVAVGDTFEGAKYITTIVADEFAAIQKGGFSDVARLQKLMEGIVQVTAETWRTKFQGFEAMTVLADGLQGNVELEDLQRALVYVNELIYLAENPNPPMPTLPFNYPNLLQQFQANEGVLQEIKDAIEIRLSPTQSPLPSSSSSQTPSSSQNPSSTPTPSSLPDHRGDNQGAIIGGSVAGAVVAMLGVMICAFKLKGKFQQNVPVTHAEVVSDVKKDKIELQQVVVGNESENDSRSESKALLRSVVENPSATPVSSSQGQVK